MYGQSTGGDFTLYVTFVSPTPTVEPTVECSGDGRQHPQSACVKNPQTGQVFCRPCWAKEVRKSALRALFEVSPPDLRKRLYRALAGVYHPDTLGGDSEAMLALNEIRDQLP